MPEEKPVLSVYMRMNPSPFSDTWKSRQQRIMTDVQSDSIRFQRPLLIPMAIPSPHLYFIQSVKNIEV
jgi:hypothetical protein